MMNEALGHKTWCIPDLYMKEPGNMPTPSHESITLLNTGSSTAEVTMDLLFDHGRPSEKLEGIQIEPMQAKHLRMDHLEEWGFRFLDPCVIRRSFTAARRLLWSMQG